MAKYSSYVTGLNVLFPLSVSSLRYYIFTISELQSSRLSFEIVVGLIFLSHDQTISSLSIASERNQAGSLMRKFWPVLIIDLSVTNGEAVFIR